ncbi:MAG: hypothetical protein ABIG92_01000 [Candidatus Omnitrophota bacterium]
MSIINDAIRKARKEYSSNTIGKETDIIIEQKEYAAKEKPSPLATSSLSSHKRLHSFIAALIFLVAFLVSVMLYKQTSRVDAVYVPVAPIANAARTTTPIAPKNPSPARDPVLEFDENAIELEGIVYDSDPAGKWAIINGKIAKEGDDVLGGKVILIMNDYIKIRKPDSEEITLDLR